MTCFRATKSSTHSIWHNSKQHAYKFSAIIPRITNKIALSNTTCWIKVPESCIMLPSELSSWTVSQPVHTHIFPYMGQWRAVSNRTREILHSGWQMKCTKYGPFIISFLTIVRTWDVCLEMWRTFWSNRQEPLLSRKPKTLHTCLS